MCVNLIKSNNLIAFTETMNIEKRKASTDNGLLDSNEEGSNKKVRKNTKKNLYLVLKIEF